MRKVLILPLLVVAVVAATALAVVAGTSRSASQGVERRIREVRRANALAFRLVHLTGEEEREVLAFRLGPSPRGAERIAAADLEMSAIAAELGALDLTPRGRALWRDVLDARAVRARERQATLVAVAEGDPAAVHRAYVRWDLTTGRATALVADLSVFNLRRLERAIAELERVQARSIGLLVGVLGASAAVVLAFLLFLERYLVRPVAAMTEAARRIATERAAVPVPGGHRRDELGVLARAMTRTAGDLVRANAELARSVSARDDFLSIASHELKTPLTALKLQIQNGLRRWPDQHAEPAPVWAAAALRQIDRVEALVAELLDLARIRTGRLALRAAPADVAELARGVADRHRDMLARAGNALAVDLPAHLELECDAGRVEQVLSNLLANAAQHAPGTRVLLWARRDGERALLTVEDEGPGIPESARDRVFDPYEKVDRERRGPGLGLGLHIARQIVEAHGGHIRAEARDGGGARLVVDLPARRGAPRDGGGSDVAARAP